MYRNEVHFSCTYMRLVFDVNEVYFYVTLMRLIFDVPKCGLFLCTYMRFIFMYLYEVYI